MKIKRCPSCGSTKLFLNAGGRTGKYECPRCGYIGVIIIEEEV